MNRLPFNSAAVQHNGSYPRQSGLPMVHPQQQQMSINQSTIPPQSQPRMQYPYQMQNVFQMQTLYQTQNPYQTHGPSRIQSQSWVPMPYQMQSRYPTQYLPQHQIYNSLRQQQYQPFGTFNQTLLPQRHPLLNQPPQSNVQWLAQQHPQFGNAQGIQPSHASQPQTTSFSQIQQIPMQTVQQYQANPVTLPTFVQPDLASCSDAIPACTKELAPVEGSTSDMAIVIEGDDDDEEAVTAQPAPSSPSPPAPKKPERSFYSEMFAEVDSMGRKMLDENGKPIRRSIESMARRPGRSMPKLAPPAVRGAAKSRAEQMALEEAVLVEPETAEEEKERSCSLKRKSAEAELDSDLGPRKKRAGTDTEQHPVSETASGPEASSAPELVDDDDDDDDDSLFGDIDIEQAPFVTGVAPVQPSKTPEPLIIAAENPGDVDNVYVPDLPKRPKVGAKRRRCGNPKPQKTTPRAAPKVVRKVIPRAVTPVAPVESDEAYKARIELDLEAELAEDERPRSPTPTSDEDEDENYRGNLKYKNR